MITSVSTVYMPGQIIDRSVYQGSTYLGEHFDSPLTFDAAYTMPTPTTEAIHDITVPAGTFMNNIFMGSSQGYWIYKLYYRGNFVKEVQLCNQEFSMPMHYDRVESVTLPYSDDCGHGRGHVPGPASSALILVAAAFAYGRKRLN